MNFKGLIGFDLLLPVKRCVTIKDQDSSLNACLTVGEYDQKLKEGKAKMSVINMIRFKLIERIFAVIKRQSPYVLSQPETKPSV